MERRIGTPKSGLMGSHLRLLGSSRKMMIHKWCAEGRGACLMGRSMLCGLKT
jgi:hypothetical protein